MPKNEIDYSNTIIYKITCKDTNIKDVYVGHTTNFVQRKHAHKQTCVNNKASNYKCKLYEVIRDNGGWQNWTMEIINFYNCKDHYEARKKEQEYFILLGATLNSIEPLPKPKVIIPKDKVMEPIKEETYLCDFKCSNSNEIETHNESDKHLKRISDEKNKKHIFFCEYCDYKCSKNSEYIKHLLTAKHISNASGNKIISASFTCEKCNKVYKSRKGLWGHNKKCNIETINSISTENNTTPSDSDLKNLTNIVIELVKSNADLQKQVIELCMNVNTNINK